MAVSRQTIHLAEQLRIVVSGHVDAAVLQLVAAWSRAWQVIDHEWVLAMEELVEMSTDGKWPSQTQIRKAAKAQAALQSATREILGLTDFAGVTIVTAARQVTADVAAWQARIVASQLPADVDPRELLQPMPDQALAAIVERTTEQIESLKRPLSRDAREAMRQALVRGVAIGENPKATARRMVDRAQHRFLGGLTRAMVIARTEVLDAHRSAAAAWQFEQTDVLKGWVWNAKLDARTCPSCWAKHGTEHRLDELGPNDHQQGRCARTPLVKSWADLGFDVEEPESVLPDAEAAFAALSPAEQLAIMGPVRLKALQDGVMEWSDLSVKRKSQGWRDSWVPVPVGKARRRLVVSAN